jgi:hypothetical protein
LAGVSPFATSLRFSLAEAVAGIIVAEVFMARSIGVAASAFVSTLAFGACSHDVDVTWTLDGLPAASACAGIADSVVVHVRPLEARGNSEVSAGDDELVAKPCGDGAAKLQTASLASLLLEAKQGDRTVGTGGPIEIGPIVENADPEDASDDVVIDIQVREGTLAATLTVDGQSCGDAGVTSFDVTVQKELGGGALEATDLGGSAACTDGAAVFRAQPVRVDSTYRIEVTSVGGAVPHAARQNVEIERPRMTTTIDLRPTPAE